MVSRSGFSGILLDDKWDHVMGSRGHDITQNLAYGIWYNSCLLIQLLFEFVYNHKIVNIIRIDNNLNILIIFALMALF